jgi:HEAT repeat protein
MHIMTPSIILCLGLAAAAAPAQDAPPKDLLPAEAPPELSALNQQKLGRAIKKLRNSNAKKRAELEDDVIAFGRGALPSLAEATTTDHAGKMAALQRCLVELVDMRDRLFVADALESKLVVMRRFAAQASGKLGTVPLLKLLPAALDDEDEDVRTRAALSLTENGIETALGVLVDTYLASTKILEEDPEDKPSRGSRKQKDDTDRWSETILAALAHLHGAGRHEALLERLEIDKRLERDDPRTSSAVRLAAVTMLATIGDEASVRGLARGLEDHHNIVQQESINALRRLVEDKPPFQGATFQQIKELERLKALLKHWHGFDD